MEKPEGGAVVPEMVLHNPCDPHEHRLSSTTSARSHRPGLAALKDFEALKMEGVFNLFLGPMYLLVTVQ
jgi:hypothetical protein